MGIRIRSGRHRRTESVVRSPKKLPIHRGQHTYRYPYPWESLAAWGDEEQASNENYLSKNAYLNPEEVTCGGLDREGNYRDEPRHTIGWYRRTVSIPENWGDRRVILKFGAVDWEATVWVNGKQVGRHGKRVPPV